MTPSTNSSLALRVGFWMSTIHFVLQMCFTAYAQLHLPQVAQAFSRRLSQLFPHRALIG